jgi:hypothetical protein
MGRARAPFEVRDSAIHGRGAWATRRIRRGTWIIEYTGEVISNEEADRRYDDEAMDQHHTFLFVRDAHTCIDAAVGGNEARFINHSCEPNCEAVQDADSGAIWIVALRDIAPGEELTYDYRYELDEEDEDAARRRYPCRCGSPRCRGTILRLKRAS